VFYNIPDFSPPYTKGFLSLNFDVLGDLDLKYPAAAEGIYDNIGYTGDDKIDTNVSEYRYNPAVKFSLKIGDYYWNGSDWVEEDSTFNVHFGANDSKVWRTVHNPRSKEINYINGSE
jgi:hypothetical protein